jgi:hypothetical protein
MKREWDKNQIAEYNVLVKKISGSYIAAQTKTVSAVNTNLLEAYWELGKYLVEFEQKCLFNKLGASAPIELDALCRAFED